MNDLLLFVVDLLDSLDMEVKNTAARALWSLSFQPAYREAIMVRLDYFFAWASVLLERMFLIIV